MNPIPALLGVASLLLSSCSFVHLHVEGWQDIPPTVLRVPDGEVNANCMQGIPLYKQILFGQFMPLACTKVWLDRNECFVFVGQTSTQSTLEHELEHCKGMYHPGDNWPELYHAWMEERLTSTDYNKRMGIKP